MILPAEWTSIHNFGTQPVGSGPYQIVVNTPEQIKMSAFDNYFGYRARNKITIRRQILTTTFHSEIDLRAKCKEMTSIPLLNQGFFVSKDGIKCLVSIGDFLHVVYLVIM